MAAPAPFRSPPGLSVQRRHLGLIVLGAVVFVLVAIWWTARGAADPMPMADTTPAAAPLTGSALPGPSPGATATSAAGPSPISAVPSTSTAVVVVDVAGRVRRPAVVTLPAGSRVIDAIRKAGGARAGVDLSGLNLARVLVDGEQVLVGRVAARVPAAAAGAPAGSSAASPSTGVKPNLNTATAAELDELPGVGPVTAQKIIDWRTAHGAFTSAEQLLEVDGIGPKTLAEIAPAVTW